MNKTAIRFISIITCFAMLFGVHSIVFAQNETDVPIQLEQPMTDNVITEELNVEQTDSIQFSVAAPSDQSTQLSEIVITTDADTYISGRDTTNNPPSTGYSNSNYGATEDYLVKNHDNDKFKRKAYMRFDVSAIDFADRATLKFRALEGSDNVIIYGMYGTDEMHNWIEGNGTGSKGNSSDPTMINWNNAPYNNTEDNNITGIEGVDWIEIATIKFSGNKEMSVDVTDYINARLGKKATFIFLSNGTSNNRILSKEGAVASPSKGIAPQLTLSTNLNDTELNNMIDSEFNDAQQLLSNAIPGENYGQYPKLAIIVFTNAIEEIEAEMNSGLDSLSEKLDVLGKLRTAISAFENSKCVEEIYNRASIYTEADTYVSGRDTSGSSPSTGYSNSNYGGVESYIAKDHSNEKFKRKVYMRFDLSALTQIDSAELTLQVIGGTDTITIYGVTGADSLHEWIEGTGTGSAGDSSNTKQINWNNAPLNNTEANGIIGTEGEDYVTIGNIQLSGAGVYSIDATEYINSRIGKKATFIIIGNGTSDNVILSKEGAANKPESGEAPRIVVRTAISESEFRDKILEEIEKAEFLLLTALPGDRFGQYPQDAIDALRSSVDEYEAVLNSSNAGFSQIMSAYSGILKAISDFESTKNINEDWEEIKPPALSYLDPDNFEDRYYGLGGSDQSITAMPFFISNFYQFANGVVEKGEYRGWINYPSWRHLEDQYPEHVRIMENVTTLAYFYCIDKPWNPYYNDKQVRLRFEAALKYWVDMQDDMGRYITPGGSTNAHIGDTAFFTKFMGETLRLLAEGPEIDEEIHKSAIVALEKGCYFLVYYYEDPLYWFTLKSFTNQYGNTFPGVLAYNALYDDEKMIEKFGDVLTPEKRDSIMTKFREVMGRVHHEFQSPMGYWYEAKSVDFGYTLGTTNSDVSSAYFYTKGNEDLADIEEIFLDMQNKYYDFVSYNSVMEPDGSLFVFNSCIQTRQAYDAVERLNTPLAEVIPLAAAYATSLEEHEQLIYNNKLSYVNTWPAVEPVPLTHTMNAYTPYAVVHREHDEYYPTEAEREEARKELPTLKYEYFNRQGHDEIHTEEEATVNNLRKITFTYLKRPDFYTIVDAGDSIMARMQFGLSLVWNPDAGIFIHNQHNSRRPWQTGYVDNSWGTKPYTRYKVMDEVVTYEYDGIVNPKYTIDGNVITPTIGNKNLPDGDFKIEYNLGLKGKKEIAVDDESISISIAHSEAFMEYIPLMLSEQDEVFLSNGYLKIKRGNVAMEIYFDKDAVSKIEDRSVKYGKYKMKMLTLQKSGKLNYTISFKTEDLKLKSPVNAVDASETHALIEELKRTFGLEKNSDSE